MAALNTTLSNNIKFLRKNLKLSQDGLAQVLDIKRSNIAAYESKNVEPRLRLILEMAKFFDINIKDFIELQLNEGVEYRSFNHQNFAPTSHEREINVTDNQDVTDFVGKSMKIRKVLEGFKAFYSFKKSSIKDSTQSWEKVSYDIDSFIQLMEHLLAYNEAIIQALQNKKIAE